MCSVAQHPAVWEAEADVMQLLLVGHHAEVLKRTVSVEKDSGEYS